MQVMRVSRPNFNTNFGAKIVDTPFLREGIDYAKVDFMRRGTFYKALEYIAQDKNMDTFSIEAQSGYKHPEQRASKSVIKVNGETMYTDDLYYGVMSDGSQCENSIINFIKRYYGQEVANKIFSKQFPWEEKVDNLEHELAKAYQNSKALFDIYFDKISKDFIKPPKSEK